MRERLEGDAAFTAITVEAERIRLFNDHISSLEVGRWSVYIASFKKFVIFS